MQCCQWRSVSHLEFFKKHVMLPQSSIMLLYQRFHYLPFHRFANQRALGALSTFGNFDIVLGQRPKMLQWFLRTKFLPDMSSRQPTQSMQFFSKVSLNWELFPEVLFFCFLIRNNKSFKETFGHSEKLSINSNMNFFASYLSWMAFLHLSTQTPVKVLSNTVLPRLTGSIWFELWILLSFWPKLLFVTPSPNPPQKWTA